jgi:hypothetical protein
VVSSSEEQRVQYGDNCGSKGKLYKLVLIFQRKADDVMKVRSGLLSTSTCVKIKKRIVLHASEKLKQL